MRGLQQVCFLTVLYVIVQTNSTCVKRIQVSIPDGALKGSIERDYNGGKIYSFRGIPYAKPPVGQYRFELPEINNPWNGVLDATQPMPVCVQPNPQETTHVGQEDCLYLNVFTKSVKQTTLKPVLFYIHGGGFMHGTGNDFLPQFMLTSDIVLVSINYRLGVYGFINSVNSDTATDAEMIGNMGFKDQVLALKWVKNNIKYFGGDPNKVTITGQSAGGMSVHGHVLSPLSNGLFHRAILMSGTAIHAWTPAKNNSVVTLANHLGISTSNYTTMMDLLRQASDDDIFDACKGLQWFNIQLNDACSTCLAIENPGPNSFLTDYPLEIIKSGNYNKVPLMFGMNNREGLLVYSLDETQTNLQDVDSHIPFFFSDRTEVIDEVEDFYDLNDTGNRIDMYSDIWFRYNAFRAAREHAKTQTEDIFFYQFAGDAGLNFLKLLIPEVGDHPGACHSDELGYLFGCAGMPAAGSLEEQIMRKTVKLWTNFVKTGHPHNALQRFQANNYNFVNISNSGLKFSVLNEESFAFWDQMYEDYGNEVY